MDKICPYCQGQHLIKNGSAYGVPTRRAAPAKWRCKDCLRQTSFKPPRGEPLWKKETAVLLYTLPNSRVSGLSRLSRHKREVVGEELSGHSVHEAWKVPRLGSLGGDHLREFADGGFHGAPGPHQTGDGAAITAVRHVLAQRCLEVDGVGRRLCLQLARNEALVADQQAPDLVIKVGNHVAFVDVGGGHCEGHRRARQIDDQMAAQAVEMLLLGRAVAPRCRAPEV